MKQHNTMLLCLLIILVGTTLASTESTVHEIRQKRSNLEDVYRVLEEQGRLGEVDEQLLRRIQSTIQQNKGLGEIQRKSKQSQVTSSPRESVLSLARARQQRLFEARSQNRSPLLEARRNSPFSERTQALGGECRALKTENSILKKQLLVIQSQQKQVQGPVRNLRLLNGIQVELR